MINDNELERSVNHKLAVSADMKLLTTPHKISGLSQNMVVCVIRL